METRTRSMPIRKRAKWRWLVTRSSVASKWVLFWKYHVKPNKTFAQICCLQAKNILFFQSRWSWLNAQISDLEYRIRQQVNCFWFFLSLKISLPLIVNVNLIEWVNLRINKNCLKLRLKFIAKFVQAKDKLSWKNIPNLVKLSPTQNLRCLQLAPCLLIPSWFCFWYYFLCSNLLNLIIWLV